ncbi:cell division protein FtsQ/DivIB [Brevundimonas balnearis]|uniref:Cell division protein FtsQ n=1 Tax=Brevundimonas balnearis TaxID=1572858 RepID=A0ABV6R308_9CAUL
MSALGRLDLSPRAVGLAFSATATAVVIVLLASGGGERLIGAVTTAADRGVVAAGFGLRRVSIEGASREAEPMIQRALQLSAGQPITRLDLTALREDVESVGWVRSAKVIRLLPDTLIVHVVEHDRLAVWQDGRRAWVIDASGQVIPGADARAHAELPLVVGAGAADAAPQILPLLRERPRLSSRLEALVRVDERRWDLRLKDGSVILLPAVGEEAALIQLDAMDQRERLLDLGFSRVDLRTPEAVALRPAGRETAGAAA